MITADERVAVELTFAEQGALMRATTLKRAQAAGRAYDDEVDATGRDGEWTVAAQVRGTSRAGPPGPCREPGWCSGSRPLHHVILSRKQNVRAQIDETSVVSERRSARPRERAIVRIRFDLHLVGIDVEDVS